MPTIIEIGVDSDFPIDDILVVYIGNVHGDSILWNSHSDGAGGGTRTHTGLPLRDFESRASANFTTPASIKVSCGNLCK